MVKMIFRCEICGTEYSSAREAAICERQPMEDFEAENYTDGVVHIPEVGEVVECSYPAWGWWHGDPDWSVWRDRGGRFLDGYYALWVVVAKRPADDRHEWRYILWTPSDQNGTEQIVWTGPGHHRCYANRKATDEEWKAALNAYMPNCGKRIRLL